MKISIARATDAWPRHVVVRQLLTEDWGRRMMLQRLVGHGVQLERHQETMLEASAADRPAPQVTYRFAMKYLDGLLLTFPMAEMSPALSRMVIKRAKDEIKNTPVPELNLRGFQMYDRAGKKVEPFDFQKIVIGMGVDALLGKRGVVGQVSVQDPTEVFGFLNNLELGLGKTMTAEATLVALHRNLIRLRKKHGERDVTEVSILIVIPNNAKMSWKRALDQQTRLDAVIVEGSFAEREALIAERHDVTIVNYETIRCTWDKSAGRARAKWVAVPKHPSLFDHEYFAVVADEYHRVSNPEAQQSIGYLHLKSKKFMPMSGTPIMAKPEQAWVTLHRIWPHLFPNYEAFGKALVVKDGGEMLGYNPEVMVELKKFLQINSVRIRKEQVMDQLPKVLYVQKDVELTREQRKIYNRIRDDMMLTLENGDERDIMSPLAMIIRLKQAAFSPELFEGSRHSAKIDELKEDVAEIIASGHKAIIGSQWAKATRILQREFSRYNPAYVDGTVTDTKNNRARTAEIDRFNNTSVEECGCVMPDTLISSAAPLSGATCNWHDGPVIDLVTSGGDRLTVTPNHPVLTNRGWIAAQLIREGDQVVHQIVSKFEAPEHLYQIPTPAHDVFTTMSPSEVVTIHGSAGNFHNDGVFRKGKVYVKSTQGQLLDVINPSTFEDLLQLNLMRTDVLQGLLSSNRLGVKLSLGVPHAQGVRTTPRLHHDTGLTKLLAQISAREGNIASQHLQALSGFVPSYKRSDVDVIVSRNSSLGFELVPKSPKPPLKGGVAHSDFTSYLAQSFTAPVTTIHITEVKVRHYSGHVYNFQSGDEKYVANGIVTHNCYIGTIGANKEAITLHAATYVCMTDKDWSPANNKQFAMRSAAGGLRGLDSGVSSVSVLEYIAMDTIEVAIEEMLLHKQNVFNAVYEKDGGYKASRTTFKDIRALLRKA